MITNKQYDEALIHLGAMDEAHKRVPTKESTQALMWLGPLFMTASVIGGIASNHYAEAKYDEVVDSLGGRDHVYQECRIETDFGRSGDLTACYHNATSPAKAARDTAIIAPTLTSLGVGFLGLGLFFAGIFKTKREDEEREKVTNEILQERLRAHQSSPDLS